MKSNCRRKLTIFQGVRAKNISIMFVNLAARLPSRFWKPMIQSLAESRDKKHYRGKGKRKTCIKTVYGEVEYKTNCISHKNGTGRKRLYLSVR